MAADASTSISFLLSGLGKEIEFATKFSTTTDPTRAMYHYMVQTTGDLAEALELGDVATIQLLIIKCVANDVDLDLDYDDTTFDPDLTIQEGECAVIPVPAGKVYFENSLNGEDPVLTSTIEYILMGT